MLWISFLLSIYLNPAQAVSAPEELATRKLGLITIEAPERLLDRVESLLQQAYATHTGKALLKDIQDSGNPLLIQHKPESVGMAGKTLLPMKKGLTIPGVGVEATIQMNFDIPDSGSHVVYACTGEDHIPFTALMNVVHELRHARDGMTGNFLGHRHEKEAVISENELREEMGIKVMRCLRDDEDHAWQVWFPPKD